MSCIEITEGCTLIFELCLTTHECFIFPLIIWPRSERQNMAEAGWRGKQGTRSTSQVIAKSG